MNKLKFAILGRSNIVKVFQIYNADVFIISDDVALRDVLKELDDKRSQYGLILLTTDLLTEGRLMKKIRSLAIPYLSMPTVRAEQGLAEKQLSEVVNKAVGINLSM